MQNHRPLVSSSTTVQPDHSSWVTHNWIFCCDSNQLVEVRLDYLVAILQQGSFHVSACCLAIVRMRGDSYSLPRNKNMGLLWSKMPSWVATSNSNPLSSMSPKDPQYWFSWADCCSSSVNKDPLRPCSVGESLRLFSLNAAVLSGSCLPTAFSFARRSSFAAFKATTLSSIDSKISIAISTSS